MVIFPGKKEKTSKELIEHIILEKYNHYYRLAFSYAHNEEDAKDIVQNGAYKALRSHHTLKDLQLAETWLYRIMLNECFQYIRRPKHISYERILDEEDANLGSTEDTYANVDLQNAIHMLPEKDKAVIILKYFEDKKLEEISHILDENISTVKSRLYRAMKKLRTVLDDRPAHGNDDQCTGKAGGTK